MLNACYTAAGPAKQQSLHGLNKKPQFILLFIVIYISPRLNFFFCTPFLSSSVLKQLTCSLIPSQHRDKLRESFVPTAVSATGTSGAARAASVPAVVTSSRPGRSQPVSRPAQISSFPTTTTTPASAPAAAAADGGAGAAARAGIQPIRSASLRARAAGEALGLRIRGGSEYNLGIFLSEVDVGGLVRRTLSLFLPLPLPPPPPLSHFLSLALSLYRSIIFKFIYVFSASLCFSVSLFLSLPPSILLYCALSVSIALSLSHTLQYPSFHTLLPNCLHIKHCSRVVLRRLLASYVLTSAWGSDDVAMPHMPPRRASSAASTMADVTFRQTNAACKLAIVLLQLTVPR